LSDFLSNFLITFINALALGSLYALIALGYTMVYGTLKFINFAHGSIFMMGAWLSLKLVNAFGYTKTDVAVPVVVSILVLLGVMVACGLLGVLIERLAYKPMRSAPRLNVLITAIGVYLFIENTSALPGIFGREPQPVPPMIPRTELFNIMGVSILWVDVWIILLSFVLMGLLEWLVFRTRLGAAMRAVSQDTKVASLMGIPVDRTISITFIVGSVLAAAAGFLYAQKYGSVVDPGHYSWMMLGIIAFVAAVMGGIGNVRGAMVGGLLIGFLQIFGATYLYSGYRDLYVFTVLIAILLIKPTGLFGKATVEKV
jgi:branched-chain amino acid transport system permease protein